MSSSTPQIAQLIAGATDSQCRDALRALLLGLVDLGFDADAPIDGGDAVESIGALYTGVTHRMLRISTVVNATREASSQATGGAP